MTTQTGSNARTLTGYAESLLEYPRWLIERDVDFTSCHHYGAFSYTSSECVDCRFGEGCRWLDQNRTPTLEKASLADLLIALQSAMEYVQSNRDHARGCHCRACVWLHEARHFLHTRDRFS
jgi:hypothetical protein